MNKKFTFLLIFSMVLFIIAILLINKSIKNYEYQATIPESSAPLISKEAPVLNENIRAKIEELPAQEETALEPEIELPLPEGKALIN